MCEIFGSTTKTCVELCDLMLLNADEAKSLASATLLVIVMVDTESVVKCSPVVSRLNWSDTGRMAGELESVRLLFPQAFGHFFVVRT